MRIVLGVLIAVAIGIGAFWGGYSINNTEPLSPHIPQPYWPIRSIDTMKYSRDLAREKLDKPEFDQVIESQVKAIAETGASHIGIATPYDAEFVPYLRRWVTVARAHNLKIWFRGNMAGWEKWFSYPRITREEHTKGVVEFIQSNADLFQDGDIFSSCPECENGGPGDPRQKGDVVEYRQFLITEYQAVTQAFREIGKDVPASYHSMNYDVAKLVMDRETTQALGGIVAIDHYVRTPEKVIRDIQAIAAASGGKVFLGEFGAPIPDLHGNMTEQEQADWVRTLLSGMKDLDQVAGLNYWTSVGGSTEIWTKDGIQKEVGNVIREYYTARE